MVETEQGHGKDHHSFRTVIFPPHHGPTDPSDSAQVTDTDLSGSAFHVGAALT